MNAGSQRLEIGNELRRRTGGFIVFDSLRCALRRMTSREGAGVAYLARRAAIQAGGGAELTFMSVVPLGLATGCHQSGRLAFGPVECWSVGRNEDASCMPGFFRRFRQKFTLRGAFLHDAHRQLHDALALRSRRQRLPTGPTTPTRDRAWYGSCPRPDSRVPVDHYLRTTTMTSLPRTRCNNLMVPGAGIEPARLLAEGF